MSVQEIPAGARAVHLSGKKARGRVAIVDAADYATVSQFTWHLRERVNDYGTMNGPYAATSVRTADGRRRIIQMHTMLTGFKQTDHRDRNGLNNTRSNLRDATSQQNNANKRKQFNCTSQYKGVRWRPKAKSWHARIYVNGAEIHLGAYSDDKAAARAYDAAALEAFGEFALINFPAEQAVA